MLIHLDDTRHIETFNEKISHSICIRVKSFNLSKKTREAHKNVEFHIPNRKQLFS